MSASLCALRRDKNIREKIQIELAETHIMSSCGLYDSNTMPYLV